MVLFFLDFLGFFGVFLFSMVFGVFFFIFARFLLFFRRLLQTIGVLASIGNQRLSIANKKLPRRACGLQPRLACPVSYVTASSKVHHSEITSSNEQRFLFTMGK